ncbi:MAG: nitrous oxide-stimulated promoter family protein [Promethearchaeota archaeon]
MSVRSSKKRLDREKKTIETMINMYCKNIHDSKDELCQECSELFEYAGERLKYCRFGESKPTCEKCPIHCYKPDARENIRTVMRYAGPRMIYTHPIMGFRHLFKKMKKFENPD